MRIACAGVSGNNSIVDFHVGREMQERNIFLRIVMRLESSGIE